MLIQTAKALKGSERRLFLARTVRTLGEGGQCLAERELGWSRVTMRKGKHELEQGIVCIDAFSSRGRKRSEDHLPNLLVDITAIVDGQSQTDPQFRTNRLYTRLTATEVRRQLMVQFGSSDDELPTAETITTKLNELGYSPPKGGKDTTPKKLPETDAIFEHLKEVNKQADANKQTLRISMDAKAIVKIGPFARGGKSRVPTKAADHDFHPEVSVTPVGIFLPAFDEFFWYGVTSKVTSDCLVDRLIDWWETVKERFSQIKTIVINGDNGPESHSRRTQFMQRLLEFAENYQVNIFLAYYPPYHSKYNPVERCWGILEQHWNGSLLDSVDTVIQFARTMTWKGKHPVVELVTTPYQNGVKLTKEAMSLLETHFQRLPFLEKWFVDIKCPLPASQDN